LNLPALELDEEAAETAAWESLVASSRASLWSISDKRAMLLSANGKKWKFSET
jgi:hypothetical protein